MPLEVFFPIIQNNGNSFNMEYNIMGPSIYERSLAQIKILAYIDMTSTHIIDDVSMWSMVCQHFTPSMGSYNEIDGLKYRTTNPRTSARPRTINVV